MVNYSDFEDRIEVIGRLGIPVGQFADVRGKWVPTAGNANNDLDFVIESVDGVTLDVPLRLPWSRLIDLNYRRGSGPNHNSYEPLKFASGETWEMRGYESAFTVGYPPGVAVKTGENSNGEKLSQTYEFESRFNYLTATQLKSDATK